MPLIFILSFIPLVPMGIESLYYALYGHAMWSLKWGNEVRAWGGILSPLCLVATYLAAKHRFKWLTALPLLIIATLTTNIVLFGISGEKMLDDEMLDLLGFWTTQWEAWTF